MKAWKGYQSGIDLGGWLSQCSHTKERYENFIGEDDFKKIAGWGADHVRLPIDYDVVETKEGKYKEEGFGYIQNAIDWCGKYDLNMVLDLHKTFGYSFDAGEKEDGFFDSKACQERFCRLWEKLAEHFGKYHDRVAFELLNEVTLRDYMPVWMEIANECIARIRKIAPKVTILVGGYWNNSVEAVKDIDLSSYDNIVLNFHCYEPIVFTHQGASWIAGMDPKFRIGFPAKPADYIKEMEPLFHDNIPALEKMTAGQETVNSAYFENMFAEAIATAEEKGVPLYCGEYGVINLADTDSTLKWYRGITPVFKAHGIGRAAWSYKEMDFGFIDEHMKPIIDEITALLFG